jgi:hypothetical protein
MHSFVASYEKNSAISFIEMHVTKCAACKDASSIQMLQLELRRRCCDAIVATLDVKCTRLDLAN